MITEFQDLLGDEDDEMLDMMGESSMLGESYDLGDNDDEVDLLGGRLRDRIRKAIKKRRARRKNFKASLKGKSLRERMKLRRKMRKARRRRIFKKMVPFLPIPGIRSISAGIAARKILKRRKAKKAARAGRVSSSGFVPSTESGFIPDAPRRRRRRRVREMPPAMVKRVRKRRKLRQSGYQVPPEAQVERSTVSAPEQVEITQPVQEEKKGGFAKLLIPLAAGVGALMLLGS